MDQTGGRLPPSLMYLETTIPFTEHYIDDDDGHGADAGPTGGLTWDGRVNTPREQALIPLFAANEMANANPQSLSERVRHASYAREFRAAFSAPGQDVFDNAAQVVGWLGAALEVYQQSAKDFYPFSSKYDAYLRHQTELSAQELRGLTLFNDANKGNCALCHPSSVRSSGAFPLFTDVGYAALGVPRNRKLPLNRDPAYFDLGLCGPLRQDLGAHPEYCGLFKAPSLRNVATRSAFFHNGVFHSLREVLEFYAQRDVRPERWYARDAKGRVLMFDDVPPQYAKNVSREAPFGGQPGQSPRLDAHEIDDLIAFLKTLTDGYLASP